MQYVGDEHAPCAHDLYVGIAVPASLGTLLAASFCMCAQLQLSVCPSAANSNITMFQTPLQDDSCRHINCLLVIHLQNVLEVALVLLHRCLQRADAPALLEQLDLAAVRQSVHTNV
jgi:hypothetical protein